MTKLLLLLKCTLLFKYDVAGYRKVSETALLSNGKTGYLKQNISIKNIFKSLSLAPNDERFYTDEKRTKSYLIAKIIQIW
jgi:hypothetical protein